MAVTANKIHLSGLARKLVQDGFLDEVTAADHFQKALAKKQAFVPYLVENKLVASNDIVIGGIVIGMYLPIFKMGAVV